MGLGFVALRAPRKHDHAPRVERNPSFIGNFLDLATCQRGTIKHPTTTRSPGYAERWPGLRRLTARRNSDLSAAETEEEIIEGHARRTNPAIRKAQESEVDATTEKLQHKFGEGHGPLPDEEIAAVVRDETEELRDAPVQAFTSLITENNARNRLQELADEGDRGH